MFREFKVEANAGKPQIAYRETITKPANGEGKLIKQSGGRGQYGHVIVDVRPAVNAARAYTRSKTWLSAERFRKNYIQRLQEAGIERGGAQRRASAVTTVIDVEVDIIDGSSYHEVDSNEMAFKMAAIFAVKDAFKSANPHSSSSPS